MPDTDAGNSAGQTAVLVCVLNSTVLRPGDTAPPLPLGAPQAGQRLVLFLRGTWCPFCRVQLDALARAQPRLEQANIQSVAIACQSAGSVQRWSEKNPLPFLLLADESRAVARAWGTHYFLSWDGINLSRPALFVVGADGCVLFSHVGRRMDDLPVDLLLARFLQYLLPEESSDGNGGA
jgi:thioredoxin-dependent peroxiredoxin